MTLIKCFYGVFRSNIVANRWPRQWKEYTVIVTATGQVMWEHHSSLQQTMSTVPILPILSINTNSCSEVLPGPICNCLRWMLIANGNLSKPISTMHIRSIVCLGSKVFDATLEVNNFLIRL
jgi:hypothetical protein